ncbi:MAG TPA: hypothetical protein VKV05_00850 [Terriglobales bacterium]|nr:hypothetical protein [Terriglobales bacterium]
MKKTLLSILLAFTLICFGSLLYAQMQQGSMGQGGGMGHHMMTPDQRLEHMTKMLDLNQDQQSKIKPMLEQEQDQMQKLRADTSLTRQERMSKMMEIRQSTNKQINGVLNSDQQKKWEEMQSRQMQGAHAKPLR